MIVNMNIYFLSSHYMVSPLNSICDCDVFLRMERTAPIVLTKEEEVEVAHILQRIKIARRKGQEEKVAKCMEKLNKIQGMVAPLVPIVTSS